MYLADTSSSVSVSTSNASLEDALQYYTSRYSNKNTVAAKTNDIQKFLKYLSGIGVFSVEDLKAVIKPALEAAVRGYLNNFEGSKSSLARNKNSICDFLKFTGETFGSAIPVINDPKYRYSKTMGTTKAITLEEWKKLEKTFNTPARERLHIICQTALLLGGRRISEILNLNWEDLNFDLATAAVLAKNGVSAVLPMPERLIGILTPLRSSGKVFDVSRQSIDELLKKCCSECGLEDISFHSLRVSFVTWAIERGDEVGEIMNATLHSDVRMVRYYDRTSRLKVNSSLNLEI